MSFYIKILYFRSKIVSRLPKKHYILMLFLFILLLNKYFTTVDLLYFVKKALLR